MPEVLEERVHADHLTLRRNNALLVIVWRNHVLHLGGTHAVDLCHLPANLGGEFLGALRFGQIQLNFQVKIDPRHHPNDTIEVSHLPGEFTHEMRYL